MRFSLFALIPALALASPIDLPIVIDEPDPALIRITGVNWSGNGCPQGTVSTSISADRTIVTFGFDAFQTYIGPGLPMSERTKNCQLHLTLSYPGGFQFAVVESTYHGYAILERGVTGTFFSTYYFSQDALATTTTRTSISGGGEWEFGNVYTKQDQIPTASVVWSPCGATGNLNINNRIGLTTTNATAFGSITDDDATVAFTQQMNMQWRSCP
ncbi:hypothetical protein S40288_04197 [Stachybotrys chartarum IBT 40288]|nr:hypothetical protein S40288_04197 [Stachybotrys chartarum IBT 40288]